MKTSSSELEAANKIVPKIDGETGIERHKSGKAELSDVRDGEEINPNGTIKGALRILRG